MLAERRAKKIFESLDSSVPTNLTELGRRRGLGAIRFRPILGSAGLLKTQQGFDVVVNTEARGAETRPKDILLPDSDWNILAPPVRFTIAHEIAHTVLIEIAEGDTRKEVFIKNEEAVDTLCNDLASKFLMPSTQIDRALGSKKFNAVHIAGLPNMFRVSVDALMYRLDSADLTKSFSQDDGLIALLREVHQPDASGGTLQFIAGKLCGARALNQFGLGPKDPSRGRETKFPSGRSITEVDLGDISSDLLRQGQHDKHSISVQWRGGQPDNLVDCEVEFQKIYDRPVSLILTVQVTAGPAPK